MLVDKIILVPSKKEYITLCNKWYQSEALERFKENNSDDYDEIEIYDAYKTSEGYFDADDRANVIWEIMI